MIEKTDAPTDWPLRNTMVFSPKRFGVLMPNETRCIEGKGPNGNNDGLWFGASLSF